MLEIVTPDDFDFTATILVPIVYMMPWMVMK